MRQVHFLLMAFATLSSAPASSLEYRLTYPLISHTDARWHIRALQTEGEDVGGEGCSIVIDRSTVTKVEGIITAGALLPATLTSLPYAPRYRIEDLSRIRVTRNDGASIDLISMHYVLVFDGRAFSLPSSRFEEALAVLKESSRITLASTDRERRAAPLRPRRLGEDSWLIA